MCTKKKKITDNEKLIQQLLLIRNSAFCSYTLPRARRILSKISTQLLPEEVNKLKYYIDNIDVENPDVYLPQWARSGGATRQLMHQRAEFANYVHTLIEKRKRVTNYVK